MGCLLFINLSLSTVMFNHQEANISGLNMCIDRDYLYFRAKVNVIFFLAHLK